MYRLLYSDDEVLLILICYMSHGYGWFWNQSERKRIVVRMRLYFHTSPHVGLVVLIGSTGENKGLVANILLVLIPEGKIYLKVQR